MQNGEERRHIKFCSVTVSFVEMRSSFSTPCFLSLNLNPLSANPRKWSNTLKQFVGKSRRIV